MRNLRLMALINPENTDKFSYKNFLNIMIVKMSEKDMKKDILCA
jgi:hypothetical protein